MSSAAAARAGRIGASRWLPHACVLLAACMWGTIGTSYQLILDHVATDEVTIVTIRAVAAALLLAGWLAWREPSAFRVRRPDLPFIVLFAVVTVTIFYIALIYAFAKTSVAVGTVLLYLAPALVTLGAAIFFRERLTRWKLLALAATLLGCVLVVGAYRPSNLDGDALGIALSLLSAATYAAYSLMGKRLLGRYRMETVLAYDLLIGSAGLLIVKLAISPTAWPSLGGVLAIGAYNGIVTTLAPITLYTIGLRGLPSSEASILATLEPVVAVILAATVLGQSLSPVQTLGAACIVGAVVSLVRKGTAPAAKPEAGWSEVPGPVP